MRRSPGFFLAATLTLGLGVGANTAFFSLVNGLLLKPLRVTGLNRLAAICLTQEGVPNPILSITAERFRRLQDHHLTLVGGFSGMQGLRVAASADRSKVVKAEAVFGNYFAALGVTPKLGRLLGTLDDDARSEGAVVISERLWRQWFQAAPEVLGRVVVVAAHPLIVVGVVPESFQGLHGGNILGNDLWFPSRFMDPSTADHWTIVFARLRPGVTLRQADAEMRVAGADLGPLEAGTGLALVPLADKVFVGPPVFYAIAAAVLILSSLVLFIACANLTNLLLARLSSRKAELAVRLALGANRRRVIQLFASETCLLAALGGCLGLVISHITTRLLTLIPLPESGGYLLHYDASADWRVFGFAFVTSIVSAGGITMAVASQAQKVDGLGAMSTAGGAGGSTSRSSRARTRLVASQMACGVVLLVSAGVIVRSTLSGLSWQPGFQTAHVGVGQLDYKWQGLKESSARQVSRDIVQGLGTMPGVVRAVLASELPGNRSASFLNLIPQDERGAGAGKNVGSYVLSVTPGFFGALGISVLGGRDFNAADSEYSEGVAIVNESAARAVWGAGNPLGRRLEIRDSRNKRSNPEPPRRVRIVGVVGDTRTRSSYPADHRLVFVPLEQRHTSRLAVIVQGSAGNAAVVETLKDAVRRAAPQIALYDVQTMAEEVGGTFMVLGALALVMSAVGVLGVFIAAVGLYGVIAYTMSQRTRELGVMKALGARNAHIYSMVAREVCRMLLLGIVPGLLLAELFVQFLRRFLPGIQAYDWVTFLVVPLALSFVGLAACLLPVRVALRMEPYAALREL